MFYVSKLVNGVENLFPVIIYLFLTLVNILPIA